MSISKSPTRVALLGAGSFTFGPAIIWQLLVEERFSNLDLRLIDLNAPLIERLQAIAKRISEEQDLKTEISCHTEWSSGLNEADYVICAIDPGMMARYEAFQNIASKHYQRHIHTEFGGLNGLANSYAQIHMIREVTAAMQQACPGAILLDSANPLARVCQAADREGVATVGFCSASREIYRHIWQILHGKDPGFQFSESESRYQAVMAGLNHFCYLLGLTERESGRDVLPQLKEAFRNGSRCSEPEANRLFEERGYLPAPNDHHYMSFLGDLDPSFPEHGAWHGGVEDREKRDALFDEVAQGTRDWQDIEPYSRCWEQPARFIRAHQGLVNPAHFHSLNLKNEGQIPNLPNGIFVETPCLVERGAIQPETHSLPASILPELEAGAQLNDVWVKAVLADDRDAIIEAAEAYDPIFVDPDTDRAAIHEMLDALDTLMPWGKTPA